VRLSRGADLRGLATVAERAADPGERVAEILKYLALRFDPSICAAWRVGRRGHDFNLSRVASIGAYQAGDMLLASDLSERCRTVIGKAASRSIRQATPSPCGTRVSYLESPLLAAPVHHALDEVTLLLGAPNGTLGVLWMVFSRRVTGLEEHHGSFLRMSAVLTLEALAEMAAASRPAADDDRVSTSENRAVPPETGQPRQRVLVVDDDPQVTRILRRHLSLRGDLAVTVASTAEMALDISAQAPPSVVVIDLNLPGRDGFWLLGELRRLQPKLPAIAYTGYSDIELIEKADQAGFDACYVKGGKLSHVVEDVLTRVVSN